MVEKKDSKKAPQSSTASPEAPVTQATQAPATEPTANVAAPDAAPPASASVETEEQRMVRDRDAATARVTALLAEVSEAAAKGDVEKISSLSREISETKAHATALDVALTSRTFAPTVAALVKGALDSGAFKVPQVGGRLVVQLTFEAGALTSAVPVTIDSVATAKRAAMSGAPVTQARSNLRAAQIDPRAPSAGWKREHTSHGVTWTIVSLGDGLCRATDGKTTIEGSLNKAMLTICRGPVNAYKALGLGEAGSKWSDAAPGAWVKA